MFVDRQNDQSTPPLLRELCVLCVKIPIPPFSSTSQKNSVIAPKSRRIRSYEKFARNPFRIRGFKTQDLKPFRIRSFRKTGVEAPTCFFPQPKKWACNIQVLRSSAFHFGIVLLGAKESLLSKRLEGKVAAITGGNQGIGLGIAERFIQEGAAVAICYRSDAAGSERVAESLRASGGKAIAIQADVSNLADGQRFISETVSQLGELDILVNNAGVEKRADFWDVTEADYDFVLDVNLKGLFFMTQAAVRYLMQAKRPGKIINISSVHEELPFPHFTSYCASKGGLKMITRNLSIELAPLNITINNIAPGAIETPINKNLLNDPVKLKSLLENIPLRRLGKPEDVASIAAFLASDESSYVTGTTFVVDGGLTWNYEEQ
jgi:glucose 1-dehydrogenase